MNNQPIGVLDSGVGGLSIWKEIINKLPQESTIYIADSLNCPYGNKTQEEIYRLAKQLVEFLLAKNVKLIVLACNTVTVSSLGRLRKNFPQIPIIGTVPVVKTAVKITKNKKIGILSTCCTANSDYQKKLIKTFANDCEVFNVGTDKLVPFIERGQAENEEFRSILKKELQPFLNKKVDVVALGCSHFPLIKDQIQDFLGISISLLDSGAAIARQVERVIKSNNSFSGSKNAKHDFYVTGEKKSFLKVLEELIGYNGQVKGKIEVVKL